MTKETEQETLNSKFGHLTNKRVTYYIDKNWLNGKLNWLNGKIREDVFLNQVVSVRHETERYIFYGLFLIVLGVLLLSIIIGILPLIIGIGLIIGYPKVVVTTAGGTTHIEYGWPWHKNEARQFVDTLNTQLISK